MHQLRKIGLDSGMLISLVDNSQLFSEYALKIENEEGLLFTHEICLREAVDVLVRDYRFVKDDAYIAVMKFIRKYNIGVLPRDRTNAETVRMMFRECKKAGITFHPPDCFIIADFYRNGINKIYSNNNHFLDACGLFGIDTSKLTTTENEIKKQMREMFKRRS